MAIKKRKYIKSGKYSKVKPIKEETVYPKSTLLDVVDNRIIGFQSEGKNLYMVVWQRMANSGIELVWAKDEEQAHEMVYGLNSEVRHTIVGIDPAHMPVTDGRKPE